MIIAPLLFLLLDLFCASLFDRWLVLFLPLYGIALVQHAASPRSLVRSTILAIFIEDILLYGRAAISMLYIVPLLMLAPYARTIFIDGIMLPALLGYLFFFITHRSLVSMLGIAPWFEGHSTIVSFFINLVILMLFLKYIVIKRRSRQSLGTLLQ